eukprot:2222614-Pleurochrysis_carterae.AAC.1
MQRSAQLSLTSQRSALAHNSRLDAAPEAVDAARSASGESSALSTQIATHLSADTRRLSQHS